MGGNGAPRSFEQGGGIGFRPVFHLRDHLRELERFAVRTRGPAFWISMRR